MIRVKTDEPENLPAFQELIQDLYPHMASGCKREIVRNEVIYLYKGMSSVSPAVLMAHYDVVPADETAGWAHPPFSGDIGEGRVWGRGTLDTKCTLCAALEAAEKLLDSGFVPQNDIYFCFGGDEETKGLDAQEAVCLLKQRNVYPSLVLDEGGAVIRGDILGIKGPFALIGLAEKGYMDVELVVRSAGGHTSVPPKVNPTSVMAEAIKRINSNPFDFKMNDMSKALIATVSKYASFRYRFVFANYWLFGGLVRHVIRKTGQELDALSRTTGAVTMLEASPAPNVIPSKVRAVANFRIAYQSSCDETLLRIQETLSDLDIEINILTGEEPSKMSIMDCPGFEKVKNAILGTWGKAAIFPYLMMAGTDARRFTEISDSVYRFSPLELSRKDLSSIHGVNESIDCEMFGKSVEFYVELIKSL
jgi:carboxypeptidase PM20D1